MKRFEECCKEVGYDPSERISVELNKKRIYFAYKDGECLKTSNQDEAKKFSNNVELGWDPESVITHDNWFAKRRELESLAYEVWNKALREEYSYLSDEIFSICLSQAYDRGHSSGYDEVANCMIDVVEFAESIIKARAKQND